MQIESKKRHFFTRRPLTALSKTVVVSLFGIIIAWTAIAVVIRIVPLLIISGVMLLVAGIVATGIRWTPLLGSLMSGIFLYVFAFKASWPAYHLAHPKDAYGGGDPRISWLSFAMFVVMLLFFWGATVGCVAGVAAVIQNYWQRERRTPAWFTTVLAGLIGVLLGAILLGLLAQPAPAAVATTTGTGGTPSVHMGIGSFAQPSITIAKGSKLLLIDDGSYTHILANGSWQGGQPKAGTEAGAPSVKQQISSGSTQIGPFTTAGTYHIYCTVHQGMNLTIIVQ